MTRIGLAHARNAQTSMPPAPWDLAQPHFAVPSRDGLGQESAPDLALRLRRIRCTRHPNSRPNPSLARLIPANAWASPCFGVPSRVSGPPRSTVSRTSPVLAPFWSTRDDPLRHMFEANLWAVPAWTDLAVAE